MAKKIYDGKVSSKRGRWTVDLRKHSIKDTGIRSRKKHEDSPQGMYEEVDKRYAETIAFGTPFSLTTPLGIQ